MESSHNNISESRRNCKSSDTLFLSNQYNSRQDQHRVLEKGRTMAKRCESQEVARRSQYDNSTRIQPKNNEKNIHWSDRQSNDAGENSELFRDESISGGEELYRQDCSRGKCQQNSESDEQHECLRYHYYKTWKSSGNEISRVGTEERSLSSTSSYTMVDVLKEDESSNRKNTKLVLGSLNVHGYDKNVIIELLKTENIDILAMQECWKFEIPDISGYKCVYASSMNIDEVQRGRPFGGNGFYIRDQLQFSKLSHSKSHISIVINESIAIHNLYLSAYDARKDSTTNEQNFLQTTGIPETIYSDEIIIGDMNCDPGQKNQGRRLEIFSEFLNDRGSFKDIGLSFHTRNLIPSTAFSYISTINGSHRLLDRIVCTASTENYFTDIKIDKTPRKSDHFCIIGTLELVVDIETLPVANTNIGNRVSIHRAKNNCKALQAFTRTLDKKCLKLHKFFERNPNTSAREQIDKLMNALECAATECLPKVRNSEQQKQAQDINLVDYNRLVKPLRKKIVSSYKEWQQVRYTQFSEVYFKQYNNMRTLYTSAMKKLKNDQDQLKCDMITSQNYYKEMNKKMSKLIPPKVINDCEGSASQLIMWTEFYKKNLNCYDVTDSVSKLDEFSDGGYQPQPLHAEAISKTERPEMLRLEEVTKIIKNLDMKKASSYSHHLHWKYAPQSAVQILTNCLNAFWHSGLDIGDSIWSVNLTTIPKSRDRDLSLAIEISV